MACAGHLCHVLPNVAEGRGGRTILVITYVDQNTPEKDVLGVVYPRLLPVCDRASMHQRNASCE